MKAKHTEKFPSENETSEICYWKEPGVGWMIYLPGCGCGALSKHTIEEHGDGTISVSPSILLTGHDKGTQTQRHGFLKRGEWQDA